MLTKPLDSVLLSLKLMGLPDPRRALLRCITPPDEDQIVSAAAYLFELGAVEGPEVSQPVGQSGRQAGSRRCVALRCVACNMMKKRRKRRRWRWDWGRIRIGLISTHTHAHPQQQ